VDGAVGSVCAEDKDCESMLCAIESGSSYGRCTDGELGSRCAVQADCVEGTCAYSIGLGRGECTDGEIGSFCAEPKHGASMHCYKGGNRAGRCTTGWAG